MTTRTELPAARARLDPLRGEKLLCAVSGGLDSVCLLHYTLDWGRKTGTPVYAAHFHHGLRGETADRDEAFVRRICQAWDVPLTVGRGDTRKAAEQAGLSLEEAARDLRYAFLRKTAAAQGCTAILTAHHAQDNAETMLLNLIRGTGLKGLCGIPPRRDQMVRIFLDIPRAELAAYAQGHHLSFVEDETNFDPEAADRNFLRLKVMPLLLELNPRAVEHMSAAAGELRALEESIEPEVQQVCSLALRGQSGLRMPLSVLRNLPQPLEGRVFLGLFEKLGVGCKDVGRVHLEALSRLVRRGAGQLDLPYGLTARCEAGQLFFGPREKCPERTTLLPERLCRWGPYRLTLRERPAEGGLCLAALPEDQVEIGPCPPSARLHLAGSRGGRTVKRLAQEQGFSPAQRDALPALYVDGVLAAVWPLGVDEKFLPVGNACRFIEICKETEEKDHEK